MGRFTKKAPSDDEIERAVLYASMIARAKEINECLIP